MFHDAKIDPEPVNQEQETLLKKSTEVQNALFLDLLKAILQGDKDSIKPLLSKSSPQILSKIFSLDFLKKSIDEFEISQEDKHNILSLIDNNKDIKNNPTLTLADLAYHLGHATILDLFCEKQSEYGIETKAFPVNVALKVKQLLIYIAQNDFESIKIEMCHQDKRKLLLECLLNDKQSVIVNKKLYNNISPLQLACRRESTDEIFEIFLWCFNTAQFANQPTPINNSSPLLETILSPGDDTYYIKQLLLHISPQTLLTEKDFSLAELKYQGISPIELGFIQKKKNTTLFLLGNLEKIATTFEDKALLSKIAIKCLIILMDQYHQNNNEEYSRDFIITSVNSLLKYIDIQELKKNFQLLNVNVNEKQNLIDLLYDSRNTVVFGLLMEHLKTSNSFNEFSSSLITGLVRLKNPSVSILVQYHPEELTKKKDFYYNNQLYRNESLLTLACIILKEGDTFLASVLLPHIKKNKEADQFFLETIDLNAIHHSALLSPKTSKNFRSSLSDNLIILNDMVKEDPEAKFSLIDAKSLAISIALYDYKLLQKYLTLYKNNPILANKTKELLETCVTFTSAGIEYQNKTPIELAWSLGYISMFLEIALIIKDDKAIIDRVVAPELIQAIRSNDINLINQIIGKCKLCNIAFEEVLDKKSIIDLITLEISRAINTNQLNLLQTIINKCELLSIRVDQVLDLKMIIDRITTEMTEAIQTKQLNLLQTIINKCELLNIPLESILDTKISIDLNDEALPINCSLLHLICINKNSKALQLCIQSLVSSNNFKAASNKIQSMLEEETRSHYDSDIIIASLLLSLIACSDKVKEDQNKLQNIKQLIAIIQPYTNANTSILADGKISLFFAKIDTFSPFQIACLNKSADMLELYKSDIKNFTDIVKAQLRELYENDKNLIPQLLLHLVSSTHNHNKELISKNKLLTDEERVAQETFHKTKNAHLLEFQQDLLSIIVNDNFDLAPLDPDNTDIYSLESLLKNEELFNLFLKVVKKNDSNNYFSEKITQQLLFFILQNDNNRTNKLLSKLSHSHKWLLTEVPLKLPSGKINISPLQLIYKTDPALFMRLIEKIIQDGPLHQESIHQIEKLGFLSKKHRTNLLNKGNIDEVIAHVELCIKLNLWDYLLTKHNLEFNGAIYNNLSLIQLASIFNKNVLIEWINKIKIEGLLEKQPNLIPQIVEVCHYSNNNIPVSFDNLEELSQFIEQLVNGCSDLWCYLFSPRKFVFQNKEYENLSLFQLACIVDFKLIKLFLKNPQVISTIKEVTAQLEEIALLTTNFMLKAIDEKNYTLFCDLINHISLDRETVELIMYQKINLTSQSGFAYENISPFQYALLTGALNVSNLPDANKENQEAIINTIAHLFLFPINEIEPIKNILAQLIGAHLFSSLIEKLLKYEPIIDSNAHDPNTHVSLFQIFCTDLPNASLLQLLINALDHRDVTRFLFQFQSQLLDNYTAIKQLLFFMDKNDNQSIDSLLKIYQELHLDADLNLSSPRIPREIIAQYPNLSLTLPSNINTFSLIEIAAYQGNASLVSLLKKLKNDYEHHPEDNVYIQRLNSAYKQLLDSNFLTLELLSLIKEGDIETLKNNFKSLPEESLDQILLKQISYKQHPAISVIQFAYSRNIEIGELLMDFIPECYKKTAISQVQLSCTFPSQLLDLISAGNIEGIKHILTICQKWQLPIDSTILHPIIIYTSPSGFTYENISPLQFAYYHGNIEIMKLLENYLPESESLEAVLSPIKAKIAAYELTMHKRQAKGERHKQEKKNQASQLLTTISSFFKNNPENNTFQNIKISKLLYSLKMLCLEIDDSYIIHQLTLEAEKLFSLSSEPEKIVYDQLNTFLEKCYDELTFKKKVTTCFLNTPPNNPILQKHETINELEIKNSLQLLSNCIHSDTKIKLIDAETELNKFKDKLQSLSLFQIIDILFEAYKIHIQFSNQEWNQNQSLWFTKNVISYLERKFEERDLYERQLLSSFQVIDILLEAYEIGIQLSNQEWNQNQSLWFTKNVISYLEGKLEKCDLQFINDKQETKSNLIHGFYNDKDPAQNPTYDSLSSKYYSLKHHQETIINNRKTFIQDSSLTANSLISPKEESINGTVIAPQSCSVKNVEQDLHENIRDINKYLFTRAQATGTYTFFGFKFGYGAKDYRERRESFLTILAALHNLLDAKNVSNSNEDKFVTLNALIEKEAMKFSGFIFKSSSYYNFLIKLQKQIANVNKNTRFSAPFIQMIDTYKTLYENITYLKAENMNTSQYGQAYEKLENKDKQYFNLKTRKAAEEKNVSKKLALKTR